MTSKSSDDSLDEERDESFKAPSDVKDFVGGREKRGLSDKNVIKMMPVILE